MAAAFLDIKIGDRLRVSRDPWQQRRHALRSANAFALMRNVARIADDAVFHLEPRGRGADIDHLIHPLHELLELQRAVVERTGKSEAVIDQYRFPRPIPLVHAADLRHRGVAFVEKQEKIIREKIQQRARRRSRFPAREMATVVLDPLAEAHLLHHLDVVLRPHPQTLRLQQLAFFLELIHPRIQLLTDRHDRLPQLVARRHELLGRKDRVVLHGVRHRTGQHIHRRNSVDLVAKKLHTDRLRVHVGRYDLHDIAAHAKRSTF